MISQVTEVRVHYMFVMIRNLSLPSNDLEEVIVYFPSATLFVG